MTSTDETGIDQLVAAAKAGDAEAFGALFDAYHDAVYRYVASRVGRPSGAPWRATIGTWT